jgi:hypothetical protein
MAGNAAALRNALVLLGFADAAARMMTDDQGMDDLVEFALLTDSEVENLCKVIRRPGGTIANPNALNALGAAVAGQPAIISNPGHVVPLRAENNLKIACYFLRYKQRVSRPLLAAHLTLANVRALKGLKDWEDSHKDVDKAVIDKNDWPRTIEAIEEYFRGCLGVTKIPLAYILRDESAVPATDPAGGYATEQAELIARAPHTDSSGAFTATYLSDRSKGWELLSALTRDQDCWTYVRPAQRDRDGRMAFLGLKNHFLGANNVDNMSARAERQLRSNPYTGEKRRWNFEKYVKLQKDQHIILEGLIEHGYSGIDNRSKVRLLLDGIKTTSLDTVKTRIMSEATLRSDFDACVNLFKDFIDQRSSSELREVHIAAVHQGGGAGGANHNSQQNWDDVVPDMSVPDRYYTTPEYQKLTLPKRAGLKIKREKRGGPPRRGGGKPPEKKRKGNKDKLGKQTGIHLSNRSIKALVTAMKDDSTEATTPEDDSSSEDEDIAMSPPASKKSKKGSNRTNSALQRQGSRR